MLHLCGRKCPQSYIEEGMSQHDKCEKEQNSLYTCIKLSVNLNIN